MGEGESSFLLKNKINLMHLCFRPLLSATPFLLLNHDFALSITSFSRHYLLSLHTIATCELISYPNQTRWTQPANSFLILKINFYQQYLTKWGFKIHAIFFVYAFVYSTAWKPRNHPGSFKANSKYSLANGLIAFSSSSRPLRFSPREFILSVASKISSQPLTNPDPNTLFGRDLGKGK